MNTKDLITQNKNVYNKIAHLFAETRQYLWDDLKPLQKYVQDGFSILDLGCGTGRLYHLFSKFQGIDYAGLDQSEKQIEMAQKEFPDNIYIVAEMTSLPFEDKRFDVVYCIATFHHLPDEETRLKSLSEMKRVLKPGGKIIMTNWNLYSKSAQKTVEKGKWSQDNGEFMVPWLSDTGEILGTRYYHGFTLDELDELFKKTDLKIEDQYYSHKGKKGGVGDSGNIVSVVTVTHPSPLLKREGDT
ncbi:MAG: methyltransferase domain-containing protein [Candidatus Magasanikbacteria bacterium]|nr:methyltransferase domain-containing protein [Candidatus Magasanikbacteria bacterium]